MRTIFTPDISPPGVAIRKSTMSSADEREIGDQDGLACVHLEEHGPEADDLVHLRQLLLRLISHCWVYRALQQLRQRLNVHSEIQNPLLP